MSSKILIPQISQIGIENKIFSIRGKKAILDKDIAFLYGVKPIALRQQVKRNKDRFPDDFMVQLTKKESDILVSQNVIPSKRSLGGALPYAFTEQGVAMLSSVLTSKKAVMVNIQIMRAFIKLRELMISNKEIFQKVSILEKSVWKNEKDIKVVFNAMNKLMLPEKHTIFTLSKTKMKVVDQEIQEALIDLNRKPKPDVTGAIQHATAAVECILRNITGEHNATLGQILKKRKDIILPPLNILVEKAWGYASDKARHVREGVILDYSEAEFVVTQFISVANFLTKKFKKK